MKLKTRAASSELAILYGYHHFTGLDVSLFKATLLAQVNLGRDILLDISGVPYIDDAAYTAVIDVRRHARTRGRDVKLCGALQDRVQSFFLKKTAVGAMDLYCENEAEAITSFDRGAMASTSS